MQKISTYSYTVADLGRLPHRPKDSNKGTFGRVLCVCGSYGMAGAAYLCAKAALRSGAGLVEILTVRENLPVLQTLLPEAIVTAYDTENTDMRVIDSAISRATAVVCGCGMGINPTSRQIVARVLRTCEDP